MSNSKKQNLQIEVNNDTFLILSMLASKGLINVKEKSNLGMSQGILHMTSDPEDKEVILFVKPHVPILAEDCSRDSEEVAEDCSRDREEVAEDCSRDREEIAEDCSRDREEVAEDCSRDREEVAEDCSRDREEVAEDCSRDREEVAEDCSRDREDVV